MNDRLKEILEKIPFSIITIAGLAYFGYQYYDFVTSPESPLAAKKNEIATTKQAVTKLEAKFKEMNDFVKSLEVKKTELRGLAQMLQEMKATLTETIDIPAFMKMIITEGKKSGIRVISLKPASKNDAEFYSEQTFDLHFQGAYVQLLVFLDRISNATEIIRSENFNLKPIGLVTASYVNLEGSLDLKTYRYIGTAADKLGKDGAASDSSANKGGTH